MANRLSGATSPYLLQHAHNPVDWYPWGPEALEQARLLDRPILLSIGYSACHWCHVMERESFEDPSIAALMNQDFVCIKVDREERPDLDGIYMAATLAMNHGRGGWPMTVFLTPGQEPFFAGTYFPPRDHPQLPSFPRVLTTLAHLWQRQRDDLVAQARSLTQALREPAFVAPSHAVAAADVKGAVAHLLDACDETYGGFTDAPKFPPSQALALLIDWAREHDDAAAAGAVRRTLDGMACGGLFDHLGGGFARYSTDARWLVPHFEKMLYDNALLAKVYLQAYRAFAHPNDAQVARATLDYVLRDMVAPEGGFYSSTDADSEGVEGKYFVWTPQQVRAVLPAELARAVCATFDVTEGGNWEGVSVLHTPRPLDAVARDLDTTVAALESSLARAVPELLAARQARVPPARDDKVLTAWNGLMIGALADGARTLARPDLLAAAARAADFALGTLRRPDGRLWRTARGDVAHIEAYLEDYAYLAEGLIDLYEAGAAAHYLDAARALAEVAVRDFVDPASGAFFATAEHHEDLIVRQRDGHDGATPSANATFAQVLTRLSWHADVPAWRELAQRALGAYAAPLRAAPHAFCRALTAWQLLVAGPVELAFFGPSADLFGSPLWRTAQQAAVPRRVVKHGQRSTVGLAEPPVAAVPTLVICRAGTCGLPLTDATAARAALAPAHS